MKCSPFVQQSPSAWWGNSPLCRAEVPFRVAIVARGNRLPVVESRVSHETRTDLTLVAQPFLFRLCDVHPVRRAVIDVGTNSIKLLVADVAGRDVRPVREQSRQTRLGQGFYETHRLQASPIAKTAAAVTEFAAMAREEQAASIRIIATSAARDALNAAELTGAIEQASGLKVEVLSGEQEADWAFQGATTDPELAREPLLLLDVGGGSTEFILGQGEMKHFRRSFPLGTVRLLEKLPPSDPPAGAQLAVCRGWLNDFLRAEVCPSLEPALRSEAAALGKRTAGAEWDRSSGRFPTGTVQLVGTGGAASILGCMEAKLRSFDRERLEATRLPLERVRWHVEHLWGLSLEARKHIIGLPSNRADVILTGAAIYEAVMEQFGFLELRLSTRGLRFAAVMGDV
jgi:exopolyphosphatase/guanosine-5'-triphosphate,3'-diphosphate pyrophosphatase